MGQVHDKGRAVLDVDVGHVLGRTSEERGPAVETFVDKGVRRRDPWERIRSLHIPLLAQAALICRHHGRAVGPIVDVGRRVNGNDDVHVALLPQEGMEWYVRYHTPVEECKDILALRQGVSVVPERVRPPRHVPVILPNCFQPLSNVRLQPPLVILIPDGQERAIEHGRAGAYDEARVIEAVNAETPLADSALPERAPDKLERRVGADVCVVGAHLPGVPLVDSIPERQVEGVGGTLGGDDDGKGRLGFCKPGVVGDGGEGIRFKLLLVGSLQGVVRLS